MEKTTLKSIAFTATTLLFLVAGNIMAADYRSAMLANPCAGCHGTDGASPGVIPPLKGLPSKYIVSTMKAFKADKRKGTVMNRIAKGYTDEEIELIASTF